MSYEAAIERTDRIEAILKQWHEAGRVEFEHSYTNLDYDSPTYAKHYHVGEKYIRLDAGTSGAFMVQIDTGTIYGIKAYGVPNKKKVCGNAWFAEFKGSMLYTLRFKKGSFGHE